MIKLSKYIYINVLTLILFILCYFTRRMDTLFITYSIMFLHELSHLIAAKAIGLSIAHITFYPFGVNLKLRNKMVYSIADEIILYISGPLCNILLALAAVFIKRYYNYKWLDYFYISNIFLFFMNMMPIVPLDGGIILKKIMMHKVGYKAANKIMIIISAILVAVLILFSAYLIYTMQFNFSIIFLTAFLIGNIFTQKEKYNIDFVKELMFYDDKKIENPKLHISKIEDDYREIAKKFNMGNYSIVYFIDNDGEIQEVLTEKQIMNKLIEN